MKCVVQASELLNVSLLVQRTNYNLQGDTDSPTRDTPSSKYTCNYTCLYYTFNIKGKFFARAEPAATHPTEGTHS